MNLYTIGHSKHTLAGFAALLKPFQVNMVVDVRSIAYEYMGNVLGGKFTTPDFVDESGCVDFTKVEKSECFQKGLDAVIAKINSGYTIVLMCAEKDPLYCHRFLLISCALRTRGIIPRHLLSDGSEISDDELIDSIVHNQNQSDPMQMALFPSDSKVCQDSVYQSLFMKKTRMKQKKSG